MLAALLAAYLEGMLDFFHPIIKFRQHAAHNLNMDSILNTGIDPKHAKEQDQPTALFDPS